MWGGDISMHVVLCLTFETQQVYCVQHEHDASLVALFQRHDMAAMGWAPA